MPDYDHVVSRPDPRVRLRVATVADVDSIARLHLASWRSAYHGIVPDAFLEGVTLRSRLVRWERALSAEESPGTETIVAVDGTAILGVCSFGPRRQPPSSTTGEIYALHVAPAVRRGGLGTILLDDAVRRLVEREFRWAFLWVLRENTNARRFYESRGWSLAGEEWVEERDGYAIPEVGYSIDLHV